MRDEARPRCLMLAWPEDRASHAHAEVDLVVGIRDANVGIRLTPFFWNLEFEWDEGEGFAAKVGPIRCAVSYGALIN